MNPGQDIRTDSIADNAVIAPDNVYAPGTLAGNTVAVGNPNLLVPVPAGLYKTKHHPGMAYQETHFDSVRPMNHAYVIPSTYTQKATADDSRPLQIGPDATQANVWAIKK